MLDRIKASLPSLAPAEQRVGKLVLADPRAFANLPVTELADRAHVSKPTVVRFCRSVGYDGLSDFKLKLAGSVSEGVPFIHRSVDADDKTSDIAVKVIDNTVAAFLKYRNDASSFALEHAAQALAATQKTNRRIEFYGVGNSGIVAQDAQHKFFRLGVITTSGSPLASSGHIHLTADHPEGYDKYSPMVSRLLHLLIIDILATTVALRIGEELQPVLRDMKKNLSSKRYT
jgi:RpiR family carbohydrate utilization transcriptional regulator